MRLRIFEALRAEALDALHPVGSSAAPDRRHPAGGKWAPDYVASARGAGTDRGREAEAVAAPITDSGAIPPIPIRKNRKAYPRRPHLERILDTRGKRFPASYAPGLRNAVDRIL